MKEQKNVNRKHSGMETFKQEIASELGVNLTNGAENTSRENGRVGGEMVRRMIRKQEEQMR